MSDVKAELGKLARNGLLKPSNVVDAARDENSPLHHYFEWDDSVASEKWREEQARQLIRSVTIEIQADKPIYVRAYVSLPSDREHGNGYRSMQDVISSDVLRHQLADEIHATIVKWEEKAQTLGLLIDFDLAKKSVKNIAK